MDGFLHNLVQHWHIWVLSTVLVVAAVIDGWKLKVPNWLTFPLVMSGWLYGAMSFGWPDQYWSWTGLAWSLGGTAVGLGLLLPAYAIGGMGAGDVKLLAGVGAWLAAAGADAGVTDTLYAFCVSAIIGGVIALTMVILRGQWLRHYTQFWGILTEILVIRSPIALAEVAAERKSRMMLLPYGIPIALGTIAYFIWNGMLL
jgi:prepilin peptidase CpaA